MSKVIIPIRGMHCTSCEILIEGELKKIPRVHKVKVNHKTGEAEVHYNGSEPLPKDKINAAVVEAGYTVGSKEKLPWLSRNPADYKYLAIAAALLWILYGLGKWLGIFNYSINAGAEAGVLISLVVGLVAGFSTCMALVGGLVLGWSARHSELHPEATGMQKFRPHLYFNAGRIGGYTLLGGVIGAIGSALKPSAGMLGFLTIGVGVVMLLLGLKLIEIFPFLKDKSITLPASIGRFFGINKETREYSHKATLMAGAATFFVPCGFTQAMQLYAVSSGSFWKGALIMGLFALGTAPGLLALGGLSSAFKGKKARVFFAAAGLAVIILGWYNIANGRQLLFVGNGAALASAPNPKAGVQVIKMTQNSYGYSPSVLYLKKNVPVKWIVNSTNPFTCASSLVVPSLGISESLRQGENIIEFTPTQTGEIPFSCSMGMYRGKFVVTEEGANADGRGVLQYAPTTNAAPASCGAGGGGCGGCGGGGKAFVPQAGTVETASANSSEQVLNAVYTYDQDLVPNTFAVKAGQPVRFVVDAKDDGQGCMSTVMVPRLYNEPKLLQAGQKIVMAFTPTTPGRYPITCAMGVPRGTIVVE